MKKCNIVYFYCDELRTDAIGCYGNPYTTIHTPHMDEIATRGTRFTNCFCNSPVCVPSRMSQLTGCSPKDTGVYHNEAGLPPYCLDRHYETIPSYLAQHGYQTANFGKLHLPYGMQPFGYHVDQGSSMEFQRNVKIKEKLSPKGAFKTAIGGVWPKDMDYPPDQVCDNAIAWMKQQKEPYFVRISFLQPHTPIVVKQPYESLYENASFPDSIVYHKEVSAFEQRFSELIGLHTLNKQELHQMYRDYYGMVSWIDAQIGKVLDYLKQEGMMNDTIFIISADHGAMRGENGCLAKQIFAPAAQRVPLIIADPASHARDIVNDELCESLDLAKTICGILQLPPCTQFKGRDLFHDPEPTYVYATVGYGQTNSYAFPAKLYGTLKDGRGWPQRACIRSKQYRLDLNTKIQGKRPNIKDEDVFFADYRNDPNETCNLAKDIKLREIEMEMKEALLNHMANAHPGDIDAIAQFPDQMKALRHPH